MRLARAGLVRALGAGEASVLGGLWLVCAGGALLALEHAEHGSERAGCAHLACVRAIDVEVPLAAELVAVGLLARAGAGLAAKCSLDIDAAAALRAASAARGIARVPNGPAGHNTIDWTVVRVAFLHLTERRARLANRGAGRAAAQVLVLLSSARAQLRP